jgi:hypothetical protein
MDKNKVLLRAITSGFEDFSIIDWIMLAIGILRLLSELLGDDGNGGLKLKDPE